jgi:hypothetical protein
VRLSIVEQEYGELFAEDDLRRVALQSVRVAALRVRRREARLKAGERHAEPILGEVHLDVLGETPLLLLGGIGPAHARDLHVADPDRARVPVHVDRRRHPHGAEDGIRSAGHLQRDRASRSQRVAGELLSLGLVENDGPRGAA